MPTALLCDDCELALFPPEFMMELPVPKTCFNCHKVMREIELDVPSLGRIESLSHQQRLVVAVRTLTRCSKILSDIDKKSKDGKARTSIVLDYARSAMTGHAQKDFMAMRRAVDELVIYSQVSWNPQAQAIADALIELGLNLQDDNTLSAEVAHKILSRCVFAARFDKTVSLYVNDLTERFEQTNEQSSPRSVVRKSRGIPMAKVFLSYSSDDCVFAELAKLRLEALDIEVWLDHGALRPGEDWRNGIEEGIASSDAVIVVLSPSVSDSSYVTFEWAFALGKGKRIIPLLIKEAEIHPKLKALHYLDFSNPKRSDWEDLAKEIRGEGTAVVSNTAEQENLVKARDQEHRLEKECEDAKNLILGHLSRTGFQRVSFETVRDSIDPAYTDEFLMEVIRRNRPIFRRAKVKGKGPGIATWSNTQT